MIRNYFIVALRNLARNKSYTFLNLAGLTLGIVSCIIAFVLIRFELSFDNFHAGAENIYRVVRHTKSDEGVSTDRGVPFTMGKVLREESSRATKAAMIFANNDNQIDVLDEKMNDTGNRFNEVDGIAFIEPEFFSLLNFPWITGDPSFILSDPKAVALTEEMAIKYFGNVDNALNKYLRLGNQDVFKVSGILRNIPANSDFPLKIVFPYKALGDDLPDWNSTNSNTQCYLVLTGENASSQFENFLTTLTKKYLPEGSRDSYHLQPLLDIHYNAEYGNYNDRTIEKSMLRVFGLIGLFILIISCINFINLALAKAFQRSKEVGIRKSLGSAKSQLTLLYLTETSMLAAGAIIFAIFLAQIAMPAINPLINLPQQTTWMNDPLLIAFLVLTFVMIILLSGVYPALRTASLRPVQALKDNVQKIEMGFSLQKVLIVFQFVIAQGLIFCMFVITDQTNFFMNTSLGFDKEAIVTVTVPADSAGRVGREPFRNRLINEPEFKSISYSWRSPAVQKGNWWTNFNYNRAAEDAPTFANLKWAEPEFFSTYGLKIVAGRPYVQADTIREVVVNEYLLTQLGITNPEEAIGRPLTFWSREYPIVGVVKDFHVYSLRNEMNAVIMGTNSSSYGRINVSLEPDKVKEGLAKMERVFSEVYPSQVFEYEFVDESIAAFYNEEEKFSHLFKIFSGLAIAIGCMGLFGLVSLTVVRRTKEIGVRKVLGATLKGLVVLLSKEFIVLVLIASALAMPAGWWVMNKWLSEFAYQIEIGWFTFVTSVVSSVVIAWLALSFQTIKAGMSNPVDSLRSE
jgi:putative ABC transport system permease protein